MLRALPILLTLAAFPAWGQTPVTPSPVTPSPITPSPVTPSMWEQMTKTSQDNFLQLEKLTTDAETGPAMPADLLAQFRQQRAAAAASWLTSAHLWANVAPDSRDASDAIAAAEAAVKKYPPPQ